MQAEWSRDMFQWSVRVANESGIKKQNLYERLWFKSMGGMMADLSKIQFAHLLEAELSK